MRHGALGSPTKGEKVEQVSKSFHEMKGDRDGKKECNKKLPIVQL